MAKARKKLASAKTLTPNPFGALLTTVKGEVDARLAGFLHAKLDQVRHHAAEVRKVTAELAKLAQRGGKRLRAALVVTGYLATRDNDDWDVALDAGVSLELLHLYFLVHDDWMDQDDTRRGGPAVHAALTRRFASAHLGAAGAILAGDYAAALALEALCRADIAPNTLSNVLYCFSSMQQAAVIGQQLDVLSQKSPVEETYRLKTGSYTVQGPLQLGAALSGAGAELTRAIERFSIPAGIAFQLRDDMLSIWGNPKITGKPLGSDIQQGKRTLLVEQMKKRISATDARTFGRAYGNPKATAKQVASAIEVLKTSGAHTVVEQRISQLSADALAELEAAPFTRRGKDLLRGAVDTLVRRDY